MTISKNSHGDERLNQSNPGVGTVELNLQPGSSTTSSTKSLAGLKAGGRLVGVEFEIPDLTTDTLIEWEVLTPSGTPIRQYTQAGTDESVADNQDVFVNVFDDNIFVTPDCQIKVSWATSQDPAIKAIPYVSSGG